MENPFTKLGEVIHEGFSRLHKRADQIDADFASFKDKVEADVESIGGLKDRIAKLEALLDPSAVTAAVEKVSSASGLTGVESLGASKPDATDIDPVITTPSETTTIAVVPAGAVTTPVLTGAGSVTVEPGTTMHVDTETGVTVTLPHDGSEATATDASGAAVTAPPAAVAEAVAATADAGITVPSAS